MCLFLANQLQAQVVEQVCAGAALLQPDVIQDATCYRAAAATYAVDAEVRELKTFAQLSLLGRSCCFESRLVMSGCFGFMEISLPLDYRAGFVAEHNMSGSSASNEPTSIISSSNKTATTDLPPISPDGTFDSRDICPERRIAYEKCYSEWYAKFIKGHFSGELSIFHAA